MSRVPNTPPGSPTAPEPDHSSEDSGGAVPGGALPEDDAAVSHDHTLKWVLSDHMDLGETPEPVPEPPPQPKFIVRETTPTVLRIPTGAKTPPPFNYALKERPAVSTPATSKAPAPTATVVPSAVPTPPSGTQSISSTSTAPAKSQIREALPPPVRHTLEATPSPNVKQSAAAAPPSAGEPTATRSTPSPDLSQGPLGKAPEDGPTRPTVVDTQLDVGATPSDFFTAAPTPVPSEAPEEAVAPAPTDATHANSGNDTSEISADSLELLQTALDEQPSPEASSAAGEPSAGVVVVTAVLGETSDSQNIEAREVEPEAVMMMADSVEQAFETPGQPTTPTPPPVPPEAALAMPPRTGTPEKAKSAAPEPAPAAPALAATLFDEFQRPTPTEDSVPEALARRSLQKKSKPWYEEVFDDDYLRTVPFMTAEQTAREVDFIRDALALKPNSEVLDVACGYGRHAVELAQQGFRVTGLDLSLPLLIKAADHSQKRGLAVNFVHADMREMTFNGQFDAAYCVLSSFGYFDEETNLRVANGICRALKPGGRFILDIINRDYIVGDLPSRVWWEGDGCVILEEVDFNYHTSRVLIRRSVVFGNGRQSEQEISMRAYSLHEVGRLLRTAGLRVLDVSGSLATKSRFFGATSRSIIAVCERPTP